MSTPARLLASLAVLTACDYVRSADPVVPDTEIVYVQSVVVAGRSTAYLLSGNPHGSPNEEPPAVDARLSGPTWSVEFSESVDIWYCGVSAPEVWSGTAECRRARLPEPIREATRYTLAGISPMGPFRGQAVVPAAPVLRQAGDTVLVRVGTHDEPVPLTLRYATPPDVGTLAVEPFRVIEVLSDGTRENSKVNVVFPAHLPVDSASAEVTIHGHWDAPEYRVSLRLIGFEENYSRFVELREKRLLGQPWPGFGLEGVIGYFGGGAASDPVTVVVRR